MLTRDEWKALPQWACWTLIDGRKVPMNPATGRAAKSNDPSTWTTAAGAWAAKKARRWGGLNFALTIDSGIVAIDLDDCFEERDGRRQLKKYAAQIVHMLDTYTELSPSGNGLHLFTLGTIPSNIKIPGFEMYAARHFMSVTGRYLESASPDIESRGEILTALHAFCSIRRAPLPPRRPVELTGNYSRYSAAALARATATVSHAANGARNNLLFQETAALVELVNAGIVDRAAVEQAMIAAGVTSGLEEVEARRTVKSAFSTTTKVRQIVIRPRYSAIEDRV